MSIFNISGSVTKNNGGTIKALGSSTRDDFNNSSTSNQIINGGSIVVDSDSTDPIYDNGIFAFNNNNPLYMPYTNTLAGVDDKKINGNSPIENRSRTIRSILTSTAIREGKYNYFNNTFETNYPENISYDLCPDNLSKNYQIGANSPISVKDDETNCDQFYVAPICEEQCVLLQVPATGGTNIVVNTQTGDIITINAPTESISYPGYPNTICLDISCQFESTPAGLGTIVIDDNECVNCGAIMLRINDGEEFLFGSGHTIVSEGGALNIQFSVIDLPGAYDDNLYEYDVNVCRKSCS